MTILNLIMIIRMRIILIKCRQYVFQCLVPSARCHAIVGILIIEPIHLYLYNVMQCAGASYTLTLLKATTINQNFHQNTTERHE